MLTDVLGVRVCVVTKRIVFGMVIPQFVVGSRAVPQSQACRLYGRIVSKCDTWSHRCLSVGLCMEQPGKSNNPKGLITRIRISSATIDLDIVAILSNSGSINQRIGDSKYRSNFGTAIMVVSSMCAMIRKLGTKPEMNSGYQLRCFRCIFDLSAI